MPVFSTNVRYNVFLASFSISASYFSVQELIMRIETGLKNVDREFFTDLNGFQVCTSLMLSN